MNIDLQYGVLADVTWSPKPLLKHLPNSGTILE